MTHRAAVLSVGLLSAFSFASPIVAQPVPAPVSTSIRISEPYVIAAPDGRPVSVVAINDLGQVIGGNSDGRAFMWSRQSGYREMDGPLPSAINNCGEVAGTRVSGSTRHAFRQRGELVEDLGTLEPDNPNAWSEAYAINERGDVVGYGSLGTTGDVVGFLWTEETGMQPLYEDGLFSAAVAVNNRRQVAGSKQREPLNGLTVAAVWNQTSLAWTGGLGGRFITATAINAFGETVGSGETGYFYGPMRSSFYRSAGGELTELSPPGGEVEYGLEIGSYAYDIDDRGRIAGLVNLATDGILNQAAVWTAPAEFHVLASQPSHAVGINNRGEVIGYLYGDDASPGAAVLWQIHTPLDRSILDAAYATLTGLAICRRRQ